MIFVARPAFCQKYAVFRPAYDALFYYKKAGFKPFNTNSFAARVAANNKMAGTFRVTETKQMWPLIPANYYTINFGFFCKKELQLEKITKLPFKFRLGSVEQCDWLEGKRAASKK